MASLLPELPVDQNVVCSPLSVRLALALLVPGARGETREQLERFVGSRDGADLGALVDDIRRGYDGAIRLLSANRVFLRRGLPVLPAYRQAIEDRLSAQIEDLDFRSSDAAVQRVNAWVEKATEGMISGFLRGDELEDTILALVNAIYFLADWARPFAVSATRLALFHPLEGPAYQVPMMRQTRTLAYAADDGRGVEAVRIRFVATSLVVVLPRPGRFEGVARTFGEEDVALSAGLRFSEREVELELPRFEVESRLSLSRVLRRLGVRAPFEPGRADFGALTDHPDGVFLGAVEHAARIRVNERGAEAAAATAARMLLGMALDPPTPLPFHVERPFLFFVQDEKSGSVLFAGRCVSPKASSRDEMDREEEARAQELVDAVRNS